MSKDREPKQEILPPAKRPNQQTGAVSPFAPQGPTGVVSSLTTGFKADLRTRTNSKIAKEIRSQTDMVRAQTELYDAGGHLQRALGALRDIDGTLDNDQAERDAARAEAADRREYEHDERKHQRDLAAQRRQQELRDAERGVFNAEQELKKQKAVATTKLGRWWAKAEAKRLDAMYDVGLARKQNADSSAVGTPATREEPVRRPKKPDERARNDKINPPRTLI